MWNAIVIGSGIGGLAAAASLAPRSSIVLLACSVLVGAVALAPSAQAQSRGELLYSTHCIACHTTQMHWRDKKQATDWNSLKAQVRAWQATARLEWSEDDVDEVASYLNERFYRFVQPSVVRGSLKPARADQRTVNPDACRVERAAVGAPQHTLGLDRHGFTMDIRRRVDTIFHAAAASRTATGSA